MSEFKTFHPIVNFAFFLAVIGFSMVFMHPVCLAVSIVTAVCWQIMMKGMRAVRFGIFGILPILIISALINPAFNHEGKTILCYLPSGNPLTAESIIYGLSAAVMLASVIEWFASFNEIITSDKLMYLFGKIIPSLSLVLSMTLRFVPRFKERIKDFSAAQKAIGRGAFEKGIINRAKGGLKILSAVVTDSMESAIETADSMHCRGYGLPGRSAFSNYRLDKRDAFALIWIVLTATYVIVGSISGGMHFRYFPSIKYAEPGIYQISIFAAYFGLCFMPVFIEIREAFRWKMLKSKI